VLTATDADVRPDARARRRMRVGSAVGNSGSVCGWRRRDDDDDDDDDDDGDDDDKGKREGAVGAATAAAAAGGWGRRLSAASRHRLRRSRVSLLHPRDLRK